MNLSILTILLCLIVTLCFDFSIAVPTDFTNHLKLAEASNKYASPQLYVFGGIDDGKFQSSASHFNSSTGDWETTTNMTSSRGYFCGTVVDAKIYLFGGYNGVYLETAEVYDCKTGTYSQFRSLPTPRSSCSAAVLDGFIYIVGGYYNGSLTSVIRYNIETTLKEDVRPTHVPRDGGELVELRGRLYAIGGNTTLVEAYNSITDTWTVIASTHFIHGSGATAHEGRIYVCSDTGCEMYSPDIDQWTIFASPSNYQNHVGAKLVSMNRKLWFLGGGTSAGTRLVFTYDTFTETWSSQLDMNVPRMMHTAFVVNH